MLMLLKLLDNHQLYPAFASSALQLRESFRLELNNLAFIGFPDTSL